jgi:hypothetical protein
MHTIHWEHDVSISSALALKAHILQNAQTTSTNYLDLQAMEKLDVAIYHKWKPGG